jgi:hypothetical protein
MPSFPGGLHILRHTSWPQRLFLLVLTGNVVSVVLGCLLVVPTTLNSVEGWWAMLGAVGLQVVLALVALIGPFSIAKTPHTGGISLGFGVLFAAVYLGFLARDITGSSFGIDDGPLIIYTLFVGVALAAGTVASLRTQKFRSGVLAAVWALVIGTALWSLGWLLLNYTLWGSAHWYQFWLQDGAIDDFQSSGSHDLGAFLLQDVQGALFFHQVLSVVIGAIGGVVGSTVVLGGVHLWQRLHRHQSATSQV